MSGTALTSTIMHTQPSPIVIGMIAAAIVTVMPQDFPCSTRDCDPLP